MKKLVVSFIAVATTAAVLAVPALAGTSSIKIGDDYFVRKGGATVTVKKNTTVRWVWTGRNPHDVVGSGAASFRSGSAKKSGTYSRKMTKAGTYKIFCTVHSGMKMTLKVK